MTEAHKIPMALRAAYLTMHRQTNAHLAKCGITADQFVCLVILSEEDGITQQELVRRATSDPNTMRAMLVLLEKRSLVTREQHPTDGRARSVKITHKGRQLFEKTLAAVAPVQNNLSAPFNVEDAKRFLGYLHCVFNSMTLPHL